MAFPCEMYCSCSWNVLKTLSTEIEYSVLELKEFGEKAFCQKYKQLKTTFFSKIVRAMKADMKSFHCVKS